MRLDRRRQLPHQRQPPTHPARRAREAAAEILQREREPDRELVQQPPLLERRGALARAHQPIQHERFGLAQIPARGADQILPEPAQCSHALVAIHQHEPVGPLAVHDDDRHLLADLRQRPHQLAFRLGLVRPELLVAQVQLVQLDVHAAARAPSRPSTPWRRQRASPREARPSPALSAPVRHPPWGPLADCTTAKVASRRPEAARRRGMAIRNALVRIIRGPRRRVSGLAGLSGTPMRHLFWRLDAREVLLLPPLVIGSPGRAVLVLRPGPLHPFPPGHRRARRAVDVAPVTGATDAHRHPAPRAREPPPLGIRHRPGVPRALHRPRFARSSIWFTVDRATAAVTRRPGMSPRASTLFRTLLRLPQLRPSRQLLRVTLGGSLLTSTPL